MLAAPVAMAESVVVVRDAVPEEAHVAAPPAGVARPEKKPKPTPEDAQCARLLEFIPAGTCKLVGSTTSERIPAPRSRAMLGSSGERPGAKPPEAQLKGEAMAIFEDSRWRLKYKASKDGPKVYEVSLHPGGVMTNTDPRDRTYSNDAWEARGRDVVLRFNDSYAVYGGVLQKDGSLAGKAINKVGHTWAWTASRINAAQSPD